MTSFCSAALAGLLLAATPAFAQSPFDGTWKADAASAKLSARPDVFAVKGGTYSCPSCTPGFSVPADGRFHKVAGHPYWDEVSVTVVDPRTLRYINRRGGKVVGTSTDTLSADGRTLTSSWTSNDSANGTTTSGTVTETRLGPAAAGAHALSGSWRADKVRDMSAASLTVTMKADGNTFGASFPTGEHYTATLGGPYVRVIGDPSGEMIAAKRTGPRTIQLTSMRGGKVDGVSTITIAADGKTGTYSYLNKLNGATSSYVIRKA